MILTFSNFFSREEKTTLSSSENAFGGLVREGFVQTWKLWTSFNGDCCYTIKPDEEKGRAYDEILLTIINAIKTVS